MNQIQKENIINLLTPSNLESHVNVTRVLSKIAEEFIEKHHFDQINKEWEADAKMLLQIIFSKLKHLIEFSKGIDLVDGAKKKMIDPSIQIIISRNVFETVIFFNLLHILHTDENEKILIYDLWKLSSLKYRQRFNDSAKSVGAQKMMQEEKQMIDELTSKIKSSYIYKNGSKKTIDQIDMAIKKKKIWTLFEDGEVNTSYGPQKICELITNRSKIIEDQYTRYSLFSHPSKETVNVFTNIFSNDDYKTLTSTNLRITNCLIAMYLSDYVRLFPNIKETFEQMPIENQVVCSWYNKMIRDESTSINTAYKKIDE